MNIMTLKEMFEQSAEKYRDQIAFQIKRNGEYQKITFEQAAELINRLEGALIKLGVGRGDRVALIWGRSLFRWMRCLQRKTFFLFLRIPGQK
jgi:long-subunit acyl-CoA synthetase (AMP-forming)